jgi:hypothetical protein
MEEKAYTEHGFRRISSSKEQGFFRRRHMVAGAPIWRRGVMLQFLAWWFEDHVCRHVTPSTLVLIRASARRLLYTSALRHCLSSLV